jgi:rhamnogalacturonyl hydrolase YesR
MASRKIFIGCTVLAALLTQTACAQTYPLPTPAMQAIIDKDTSRHFGDAPAQAGPYATDLSAALEPAAIDKALRKVADWQLARSQPHWDRIWTSTVMYTGFLAASEATGDPKYCKAMLDMSQHFDFQARDRLPDADNLSIGSIYIDLYFTEKRPGMLRLIRQDMDELLPLNTIRPNDARIPWWWCDALFMAPPVWAKMYKATGERKYLDYIHKNWKATYEQLWDKEEHLYARDVSYKDKREPNGRKIFWSRGEGWVMGGIAQTLDYIPEAERGFYIEQLQQMAAAVAKLQDKDGQSDGLWHAGLLDAKTWPQPEVSGSALFVYGMAYGINRGYLDAKVYRPVIEKAWAGILKNVYADGRVGNIQQTGAEPAYYRPTSSFNYGVGAFMLAASELKKMAEKK